MFIHSSKPMGRPVVIAVRARLRMLAQIVDARLHTLASSSSSSSSISSRPSAERSSSRQAARNRPEGASERHHQQAASSQQQAAASSQQTTAATLLLTAASLLLVTVPRCCWLLLLLLLLLLLGHPILHGIGAEGPKRYPIFCFEVVELFSFQWDWGPRHPGTYLLNNLRNACTTQSQHSQPKDLPPLEP